MEASYLGGGVESTEGLLPNDTLGFQPEYRGITYVCRPHGSQLETSSYGYGTAYEIDLTSSCYIRGHFTTHSPGGDCISRASINLWGITMLEGFQA